MASVLVTGGAGFIGTHLCNYLHNKGYHVISLDIQHPDDNPWEVVVADVRDYLQLDAIDTIVHLAAQVSVAQSMEDPDYTLSVNVDGTSSVLAAAESSGVKRVLFASSAAVYGDADEMPITEKSPLTPQSPYAVSKIVGEELCRQSPIETCALRFFNVYGPGQSASGGYSAVIPAFKKAIAAGMPPTVFGDGTQIRDFIHVSDLVRIIEMALSSKVIPDEVNLASGDSTSLIDLLKALEKHHPDMANPLFEDERAGDIHTSIADVTLMNEVFSPGEMITLEEGIN